MRESRKLHLDLKAKVVAFRLDLMQVCGGNETANLFLCQLHYWSERAWDPEGWVHKTVKEWQCDIGLTRSKQESARVFLKNLGVIEERRRGNNGVLNFRIVPERLNSLLAAIPSEKFARKSAVSDYRKPANRIAGNPPTGLRKDPDPYKETESTTEITNRELNPSPQVSEYLQGISGEAAVRKILEQLAKSMDRHRFDTWMKPCKFAGADKTTLVLSIPTEDFRDYCERSQQQLKEAITKLGMPFGDVRFISRDGVTTSEDAHGFASVETNGVSV